MSNIGYATLQVIPSMRGVDASLKSQLSGPALAAGTDAGTQAGKGFGGGLGTALKAVGGFVLVQQATQFFKGAFAEAQESNKVGAQTEAVLKSTGKAAGLTADEVNGLASSLSKKVGIDDEVIQKGENMLLTFRNVRNEAGKGNDVFSRAAKTTVDMAVAFSRANGGEVDLQRSSILLGKALNDPVRGMSALQRVGVTFTQQQRDQVAALVASGDRLGAQKIILRELSKEFGGSAEAQVTAADKANVAWKNFQEAVGKALIPVISKLGEVLTPVLDFLSTHQPILIAIAALVGGALTAAFVAWAGSLFAAGGALAFLLSPITLVVLAVLAIAAAAWFVWTRWDTIWNWIKDHPAIAIVVSILAAPVAAFVLIIGGLKTLYENWDSIWATIQQVTGSVWDFIRPIFEAYVTVGRTIMDGVVWAWNNVGSPVFEAIKTGASLVGDAVNALRDAWVGAWGWMAQTLGWFKGIVSDVASTILDPIKVIWNKIADAINAVDIDIDGISIFGAEIIPDIHFHPHIARLAKGGFVRGRGNTDSVPALLTPGEYVMSKNEVAAWRDMQSQQQRGAVTIENINYYGPLDDAARRTRHIAEDIRTARNLALL